MAKSTTIIERSLFFLKPRRFWHNETSVFYSWERAVFDYLSRHCRYSSRGLWNFSTLFFLRKVFLRSTKDRNIHIASLYFLTRCTNLLISHLSRCAPGVSGSLAGRHFGKPAIAARHILVRSRTGGTRAQRSSATRSDTCLFSTHPVKITSNNSFKSYVSWVCAVLQNTVPAEDLIFSVLTLTSYGENFLNRFASRRTQISAILCKAGLEFDTKWFTEEITIWKEKR